MICWVERKVSFELQGNLLEMWKTRPIKVGVPYFMVCYRYAQLRLMGIHLLQVHLNQLMVPTINRVSKCSTLIRTCATFANFHQSV